MVRRVGGRRERLKNKERKEKVGGYEGKGREIKKVVLRRRN